MVAAMKNHDKARKEAISSLVGAIKKAAIDEICKYNITEDLIDRVILKEKKTVQEMIDTCPVAREDLLNEYRYKMTVIDEFAPRLMTDANEIKEVITTLLSDANIEPVKANKG